MRRLDMRVARIAQMRYNDGGIRAVLSERLKGLRLNNPTRNEEFGNEMPKVRK